MSHKADRRCHRPDIRTPEICAGLPKPGQPDDVHSSTHVTTRGTGVVFFAAWNIFQALASDRQRRQSDLIPNLTQPDENSTLGYAKQDVAGARSVLGEGAPVGCTQPAYEGYACADGSDASSVAAAAAKKSARPMPPRRKGRAARCAASVPQVFRRVLDLLT